MNIKDRAAHLQEQMSEKGIDVYIITTADYHQSEYVATHFKTIEYIIDFTGKGRVAVVTKDDARLWVDGRFFIQCEIEFNGTGVKLMKIGELGVPSIADYLNEIMGIGNAGN